MGSKVEKNKLERIYKVVAKAVMKIELDEGDVAVLLYGSEQGWLTWIYPKKASPERVKSLLGSALVKIQDLQMRREKERGEVLSALYVV